MTLYRKMVKYHVVSGGKAIHARKREPEDLCAIVPTEETTLSHSGVTGETCCQFAKRTKADGVKKDGLTEEYVPLAVGMQGKPLRLCR